MWHATFWMLAKFVCHLFRDIKIYCGYIYIYIFILFYWQKFVIQSQTYLQRLPKLYFTSFWSKFDVWWFCRKTAFSTLKRWNRNNCRTFAASVNNHLVLGYYLLGIPEREGCWLMFRNRNRAPAWNRGRIRFSFGFLRAVYRLVSFCFIWKRCAKWNSICQFAYVPE